MPDQATPLHRRDLAVVPLAAHNDFLVAAYVVHVAEMSTDSFGVCGEADTAYMNRVVREDPLASSLGIGTMIRDGSGVENERGRSRCS